MFDSLRTRRPARSPHDGLHTTASSPLRERGGISADRVVFDSSLYTRAAVHPIAARLVGLALGLPPPRCWEGAGTRRRSIQIR